MRALIGKRKSTVEPGTSAGGETPPPAQKIRLDAPDDADAKAKSDNKNKSEPGSESQTKQKGGAKAGGTAARAVDSKIVITKKKVGDPVAQRTNASKRKLDQPVP